MQKLLWNVEIQPCFQALEFDWCSETCTLELESRQYLMVGGDLQQQFQHPRKKLEFVPVLGWIYAKSPWIISICVESFYPMECIIVKIRFFTKYLDDPKNDYSDVSVLLQGDRHAGACIVSKNQSFIGAVHRTGTRELRDVVGFSFRIVLTACDDPISSTITFVDANLHCRSSYPSIYPVFMLSILMSHVSQKLFSSSFIPFFLFLERQLHTFPYMI